MLGELSGGRLDLASHLSTKRAAVDPPPHGPWGDVDETVGLTGPRSDESRPSRRRRK